MATVTDQTIPSELLMAYEASLGKARPWLEKDTAAKRYPWRLPKMQGDGRIYKDRDIGAGVTNAQFLHRRFFRRCCDCYNMQDPTHVILDPPAGPKSRGYWYDAADGSGLWYYDYFMQQSINGYVASGAPAWCRVNCTKTSWVQERNPTSNYDTTGSFACWNNNYTKRAPVLIKKDHPKATILHLYVTNVDSYQGENHSLLLNFYTINTDWTHATVTWNTRPAHFGLVANILLYWTLPQVPRWIEIEIPQDVFGVYVIPKDTDPWLEAYGVTFYSVDYADANFRPYWT